VVTYLREYRHLHGIHPGLLLPCMLAFDATLVSSTGIKFSTLKPASCFAFLMLPLGHRLHGMLIRSIWHKTGRIDQGIRDRPDALTGVLTENNFKVGFVATDEDNGVDGRHREVYELYARLGDTDLSHIISFLTDNGSRELENWPVSDLLHLMKNARSRVAMSLLAFSPETNMLITGESLNSDLPPKSPGWVFEARKPLELLKDDLAIQAFMRDNFPQVSGCGDAVHTGRIDSESDGDVRVAPGATVGDDAEAGGDMERGDTNKADLTGAHFLFPFVAISLAVRNLCLSPETRLALIQAAFDVFFRMMENYPECGRGHNITEKTVIGCQWKTFWTQSMCRKACNTCVGLYYVTQEMITDGDTHFHLALDRVGSHSVECHFGMTRSTIAGDPRWESFLSAQVCAVIIRRVMRRLGFGPYIQSFAMAAGCVVRLDAPDLMNVDFWSILGDIDALSFHMGRMTTRELFPLFMRSLEHSSR
jgi:hypothetical protein